MAKSKSKAHLELENKMLRKAKRADGLTLVSLTFIRWGGAVLIAMFFYLAIEALAGKTTMGQLAVNLVSEFKVDRYAWQLATAVFGFYGWHQRNLRKITIERLQSHNQALEKRLDPDRSTSSLTAKGDTRPEDKP